MAEHQPFHRYYFDRNTRRAVRDGLRRLGIDVIDTDEDESATLVDEELLRRVVEQGRVMFTHDADFLRIAARWASSGEEHLGIVYVHQQRLSVSQTIDELQGLAVNSARYVRNQVVYLPRQL